MSHHLTQSYSVQFQLKIAFVASHCLIITTRIKPKSVGPIKFCLARWKPPRLLFAINLLEFVIQLVIILLIFIIQLVIYLTNICYSASYIAS